MFDPELHERRVLKEMGENPTEYHYVFTKDNPYVQASKVLMHDQRIAVESTADELKAAILHWRNTALHQELEKIGWSFDEDDIQELLWNAFEHGSEWCEKGPVNIRVLCNQDKTILGVLIEQPLEGFDVERLQVIHRQKSVRFFPAGDYPMLRTALL